MELKDKFTRHEKWAEDRRRSLRGTSGPSHAVAWGEHAFIHLWLFSHSITSDSFATPWTVARQAPLSMGFPRQECSSRLPFPSSGDLPGPGIEPVSPALAGRFFTTEPPGKPYHGFR